MSLAWLVRSAPWAPWCAALTLLLGSGSGCNTSCDDAVDKTAVPFTNGITSADGTSYETNAWEGEFLKFEPQRRYELLHGLGRTPLIVNAYVSFWQSPFADEQNLLNASESAGNIAVFDGITAEHILVRNDTCQTFYLRVSALAPRDEGASAALGGAGASDALETGASGASGAGGAGGASAD